MEEPEDEQAERQRNMDEQPAFEQALAGPLKVEIVLRHDALGNLGEDFALVGHHVALEQFHFAPQFLQRNLRGNQVTDPVPRPVKVGLQPIGVELGNRE